MELQITYLIFLAKSMESWQMILMSGNEELARVNIQRGIFQGDTLSPILLVIGLIPLIPTLRKVNEDTKLERCSTKYQPPSLHG